MSMVTIDFKDADAWFEEDTQVTVHFKVRCSCHKDSAEPTGPVQACRRAAVVLPHPYRGRRHRAGRDDAGHAALRDWAASTHVHTASRRQDGASQAVVPAHASRRRHLRALILQSLPVQRRGVVLRRRAALGLRGQSPSNACSRRSCSRTSFGRIRPRYAPRSMGCCASTTSLSTASSVRRALLIASDRRRWRRAAPARQPVLPVTRNRSAPDPCRAIVSIVSGRGRGPALGRSNAQLSLRPNQSGASSA